MSERTNRNIRVEDDLWDSVGDYATKLDTDRSNVVRAMMGLWLAVAKSDPDRAQAMVSDPSDVIRRLRRLLNTAGS